LNISLASCTLFGVLATVSRPFEAQLFRHGYRRPPDPFATPNASRCASPARRHPFTLEKQTRGRRRSTSVRRSISDSDVDTIDLSLSPAPLPIHSPTPQRSVGLGIFTSNFAPPPIPPLYRLPPRSTSHDSLPSIYQPSASHRVLTRPSRLSGQASTSGFVPLSVAPQYSASTWRALHPSSPSSMRAASRSHTQLPSTNFSHRSRFSQSSISLTKVPQIGAATSQGSADCSSRSGSIGPEGRVSLAGEDNPDREASSNEIVHAMVNGTPTPDTMRPETRGKGHKRNASAPDVGAGGQSLEINRMALGWKPRLTLQTPEPSFEPLMPEIPLVPIRPAKVVRSSYDLRSRFSPDSSPELDRRHSRWDLDTHIIHGARIMRELPFRRSKSVGPSAHPDVSAGARSSIVEAAAAMVSNMPRDLQIAKHGILHPQSKKKITFDETKNKPLPRIAML
jgi:hypothetical protein